MMNFSIAVAILQPRVNPMTTAKKEQKLEFNHASHLPPTILKSASNMIVGTLTTASNTIEIGNQASLMGLGKITFEKQRQYYADAIKQAVWENDMKSMHGADIFDRIPPCNY